MLLRRIGSRSEVRVITGAIPNTPNSITHRGESSSSQDQAIVSSSFRG